MSPDDLNNLTATGLVLAILMLAEYRWQRRDLQQPLARRWTHNFGLGILNYYLNSALGVYVILWVASWTSMRGFGLLGDLALHPVLELLLLVLCSQFLAYWIHRAYHTLSWLWPIHTVHHSDLDFDVSTSYRHHPIEPLLSLALHAPLVLSLGVGVETAVMFKLFEIAARAFSHANIRLSPTVERRLRPWILTPDFHRVHHSAETPFTNSNYGTLVPWFDYLFGTARHRPFDQHSQMQLGLEYFRQPRDQTLVGLLAQPLKLYTGQEHASGGSKGTLEG